MNEKRVQASITRKLLRWLLGCFVAFLAAAVLLASLVTIAAFGVLTFVLENDRYRSVRIIDVNASSGLIFFHSTETLERYQFIGLMPFENFTIEIVIEGAETRTEYFSCKLNRQGIAKAPDYCSLVLADGGLHCECRQSTLGS